MTIKPASRPERPWNIPTSVCLFPFPFFLNHPVCFFLPDAGAKPNSLIWFIAQICSCFQIPSLKIRDEEPLPEEWLPAPHLSAPRVWWLVRPSHTMNNPWYFNGRQTEWLIVKGHLKCLLFFFGWQFSSLTILRGHVNIIHETLCLS